MVEENRCSIISCCQTLFRQKGLRRVSIEDIARETNLSKKELYERFDNKEGVIKSVFVRDLENIQNQINLVKATAENAIEEMTELHNYYCQQYSCINPVLFFDLDKYYSSLFKHYQDQRCLINTEFINHNCTRGREEGYYRENFNEEVVIMLWKQKIEAIKNQILFDGKSTNVIGLVQEVTELHLRSIASDLGIQYINQHFRTQLLS